MLCPGESKIEDGVTCRAFACPTKVQLHIACCGRNLNFFFYPTTNRSVDPFPPFSWSSSSSSSYLLARGPLLSPCIIGAPLLVARDHSTQLSPRAYVLIFSGRDVICVIMETRRKSGDGRGSAMCFFVLCREQDEQR
jgi:hypothetical protein